MALSSTVHTIDIDLADSDRGVYETLALRVARHPSESEEFLVTRVLAYCCEYAQGIEFSRGGLSDPDEPPLSIRDPTGAMQAWIDIGTPAADRLHRASKATRRVAVYVHREAQQWLAGLAGAKIHRAHELQLFAVDRNLIAACAAKLDRRMSLAIAISGQELFVSFADATYSGALTRLSL
jgi:uncharacterized protein YaeQ